MGRLVKSSTFFAPSPPFRRRAAIPFLPARELKTPTPSISETESSNVVKFDHMLQYLDAMALTL